MVFFGTLEFLVVSTLQFEWLGWFYVISLVLIMGVAVTSCSSIASVLSDADGAGVVMSAVGALDQVRDAAEACRCTIDGRIDIGIGADGQRQAVKYPLFDPNHVAWAANHGSRNFFDATFHVAGRRVGKVVRPDPVTHGKTGVGSTLARLPRIASRSETVMRPTIRARYAPAIAGLFCPSRCSGPVAGKAARPHPLLARGD